MISEDDPHANSWADPRIVVGAVCRIAAFPTFTAFSDDNTGVYWEIRSAVMGFMGCAASMEPVGTKKPFTTIRVKKSARDQLAAVVWLELV